MGINSTRKRKSGHNKEEVVPEKTALYILMDSPKVGLVQYLKESGIDVKAVIYDIVDANYSFMQEENSARIMIIDTGTGYFSKVSNRKELQSLLGMCVDSKKGTLFYTDSSLKSSIAKTKTIDNKDILRYISTIGIVEYLKENGEDYCYSGAEDEKFTELLQFRGEEVAGDVVRQDINTIDVLGGILGEKDDTVRTFDAKY